MSEHEHVHKHNESCGCGCHDHTNHNHTGHDHSGHDHNGHDHTGHDHAHEGHALDENGNCILEEHLEAGVVHTELHLHDEARVVSGRLTLTAEAYAVREALAAALERLAAEVAARGGIVGHIKASCSVSSVEMFSVTDMEVTVKRAPGQEIDINLAAIVFLVEPDEAERLVRGALESVLDVR